ncbi:hypothetical protein AUK22_04175 [bacterium CG2_30_54_10]|nr:MAG: hypothetical protein AUK22_04175 [bacterium CG2_30_54_10]
MKHPNRNLTAYLFGNLIVLCVILLGLWRGQPLFDTAIRLPNLLLILVILNTVLIFREGFPERRLQLSKKISDFSSVRRVLADRAEPDAAMIPEVLNAVLGKTGHQGMALFLAEDGGSVSHVSSVGSIPRQLSGIRWSLRNGDLVIRHPGNLGEEALPAWETAWTSRSFQSEITQLSLLLVPLHLIAKRTAILAIVPARWNSAAVSSLETIAIFLEGAIGVQQAQLQSANGRFLDSRTGLLRYDGFKESFETELERSERYKQNMTLLMLSLTPFEELPEPIRETLVKLVVGSLRASLRRLDQMFSGKLPGTFAAILTETNLDVAKLVAGRIMAAFEKQAKTKDALKGIRVRLHLGTATYPSDSSLGAGIIEKAEEALGAACSKDVPVVAFSSLLNLLNDSGEAGEPHTVVSDK